MKSVCCYLRCSTAGQNEASQRREVSRWLKANGIDATTARWFVDKESGDTLDRPAFDLLQTAVAAGEVKMIVVYKLDRISRKLRDGITTLCDWIAAKVRVVSVSQDIDFSGATGQLVASVLFSVARMEQDTRRERQAAGIAAAKERGVYIGRQPGTTKAKPARAKQLRERGLTVEEIATALAISRRSVFNYLAS